MVFRRVKNKSQQDSNLDPGSQSKLISSSFYFLEGLLEIVLLLYLSSMTIVPSYENIRNILFLFKYPSK